MSKAKIVSIILYSIVTFITAGTGLKFITASEYFTYHAQASGMDWTQVNPGLQLLMLAGFKIVGAGFLTVAFCLIFMIISPFSRHDQRWSYFAIPLSGLLLWSIIFITTLSVAFTTGANAPWGGSLFCIITLLLGFIVSLLASAAKKNNENKEELK
ncbi:MAG: hypothetical protein HQ507_09900 [Candidatus Marinimicrobia bacterium]|nr:hypothetical protein [Candidatus Neomarinimicrobiota bacterium]